MQRIIRHLSLTAFVVILAGCAILTTIIPPGEDTTSPIDTNLPRFAVFYFAGERGMEAADSFASQLRKNHPHVDIRQSYCEKNSDSEIIKKAKDVNAHFAIVGMIHSPKRAWLVLKRSDVSIRLIDVETGITEKQVIKSRVRFATLDKVMELILENLDSAIEEIIVKATKK